MTKDDYLEALQNLDAELMKLPEIDDTKLKDMIEVWKLKDYIRCKRGVSVKDRILRKELYK